MHIYICYMKKEWNFKYMLLYLKIQIILLLNILKKKKKKKIFIWIVLRNSYQNYELFLYNEPLYDLLSNNQNIHIWDIHVVGLKDFHKYDKRVMVTV